ncbi:MAG TPA: hypothetical protein VFV38_01640 [Ktedonobacteraceae bacterium]|nr:hypothetical protein [Ktedonobacteraceae bacterium]
MKDDRRLQYIILQILTELGKPEYNDLTKHIRMRCANHNATSSRKILSPSNDTISHQLKLLTDKKEVEETVSIWLNYQHFYYEVTVAGHRALAPWYEKVVGSVRQQLGAIIAAVITTIIISVVEALLEVKFKLPLP